MTTKQSLAQRFRARAEDGIRYLPVDVFEEGEKFYLITSNTIYTCIALSPKEGECVCRGMNIGTQMPAKYFPTWTRVQLLGASRSSEENATVEHPGRLISGSRTHVRNLEQRTRRSLSPLGSVVVGDLLVL